jgi:hypothetical protein
VRARFSGGAFPKGKHRITPFSGLPYGKPDFKGTHASPARAACVLVLLTRSTGGAQQREARCASRHRFARTDRCACGRVRLAIWQIQM